MAKYDKLLKKAEATDSPVAKGRLISETQAAEESKLITPKQRKNIFKALKRKDKL